MPVGLHELSRLYRQALLASFLGLAIHRLARTAYISVWALGDDEPVGITSGSQVAF